MKTTNEYEQQANTFLSKTKTTIFTVFLKNDYHFNGDKEKRDIYRVTIRRGTKKFSFNFGNSIYATKRGITPTKYDILSCLQKNEVGTYEDFCGDFGYDLYDENTGRLNKISERTYKAVCKEFENVCKIWSEDEIAELQEIN